MNFQDMISKLLNFWKNQGCMIIQPYCSEVGAGTFHNSTVMDVLLDKPWKIAYVQPTHRPTDSRHSDNPMRMCYYYQLQVVINPATDNLQEKYIESLKQININSTEHDIKFLEDDWENPSIGATGLGWEVRCDGYEISQFTYMQQMGGIECPAKPVEITYGLERVAMHVQEVDNVFDLKWDEKNSYSDLRRNQENELSAYYLEQADIDSIKNSFLESQKQSNLMLEKQLPLIAYDYALKASHYLNIMDSRNHLGSTERTNYIIQIRKLVHHSCLMWLKKYS